MLKQALETIREELLAGEAVEAAIALAVEESGLNPALLRRKAEENFGPLDTFCARGSAQVAAAAKAKAEYEARCAVEDAARAGVPTSRRPLTDAEWDRKFDRQIRRLVNLLYA